MANHQVPAGTQAKIELASKTDIDNLIKVVSSLESKIEALALAVTKPAAPAAGATREMTDDDARNVLSGELKGVKHNEAAAKLGLSYGQVYSCRLGYTFKNIHKEMKDNGIPNPWMTKTSA
jgi:hypothetical protein